MLIDLAVPRSMLVSESDKLQHIVKGVMELSSNSYEKPYLSASVSSLAIQH